MSKNTIWRRLREAGLTYQKPEREYFEADEEARQEWVENPLPKIRETVRKYRAIFYFQDEANVSLTAFLGQDLGTTRKDPQKHKLPANEQEWPPFLQSANEGHLLFALYQKRIASDEVIHFLAQMLCHHRNRHLVVLMDNARPHISKKTMSVHRQPTTSPCL